MRFWSPKLNVLHQMLTQIYPVRNSTYFLVESAGLGRENIEFSDRAVDNWYNILRQAKIEGKLNQFLESLKARANSPEFTAAVDDYLKTPDLFGGGNPVVSKAFVFLKHYWRTTLATLAALILLVIGGVVYYLFAPVTIQGYVACDGSTGRQGEHLEAASVIIPGTEYKAVTDNQGHFNMRVPGSLRFDYVEVLYGLERIRVDRKQLTNTEYRVVPCRSETPPKLINIPFQWWVVTPREEAVIACNSRPEMKQVRVYTLKPTSPISKTSPASELYVNIVLLGGWTFINGEVTQPRADPEPWAETLRDSERRQWSFEMPEDRLEIGIQICFGTESDTSRFSETALVSNYFFKE